jgi:hypothetical protein
VNELEIEERTQAALLPLLLFFLSVFLFSLSAKLLLPSTVAAHLIQTKEAASCLLN